MRLASRGAPVAEGMAAPAEQICPAFDATWTDARCRVKGPRVLEFAFERLRLSLLQGGHAQNPVQIPT